ncbi:hypothetical protein [Streptomyces sp. LaPpAH-108]|uniref:hypothetical protein n=1 Tax=Streptomyces sp. LaPpAH-108 TaxID=1155714 RepID=UPI0003A7E3A1|nr:hypothetical protein [Streptomyces sp. LaPpAH-108]
MPESRRPDAESVRNALPQAERVMAWLAAREEVGRTLRLPLGGLPSERDERLAHMADVLQATAQGLGPKAAAVWAGIPEHLLRQWLENDRDFASAVRAASSLASAHGLEPGARTPAVIRVVLLALSDGMPWGTAAAVAGLSGHRLRQLWRASPTLVALVDLARRARPRGPRTYVPLHRRPRTPGRKPTGQGAGYRLVQRESRDTDRGSRDTDPKT